MNWIPSGDTIIVEKAKEESSLLELPQSIKFSEEDVFIVKKVGEGYHTQDGTIIPPEVKVGDSCIIKGKILRMMIKGEEILLARAQDVVLIERGR